MFKIYATNTIILGEQDSEGKKGYVCILTIFNKNFVLGMLPSGQKRLSIWGKQKMRNIIHGEE